MSPSRSADLKIALIGAGSISGYHANGVRAAGRASISVLVGGRRRGPKRALELWAFRAQKPIIGECSRIPRSTGSSSRAPMTRTSE